MKNQGSSNLIRTVAGAYVLYLAYQLIQSLRAGEVDNPMLIGLCTAVFVVLGGLILGFGIKGFVDQSKRADDEDESEDEEIIQDMESTEDDTDEETVIGTPEDPVVDVFEPVDEEGTKRITDVLNELEEEKEDD